MIFCSADESEVTHQMQLIDMSHPVIIHHSSCLMETSFQPGPFRGQLALQAAAAFLLNHFNWFFVCNFLSIFSIGVNLN